MSTFAPTLEQRHIHQLFRTGENIRVRAGAGTGKTTTLLQLADILAAADRDGLYVAFNKAIADEAGAKFGGHVTASTAHSLAYRGIATTRHAPLLERMRRGTRIPIRETGTRLKVREFATSSGGGAALTAYNVTRAALSAVDRFCRSADTELCAAHIARIPGLDHRDVHAELVAFVLPYAQRIWDDLRNPRGNAVAFGHSHYLKLWALERPRLGNDGGALFLDEAQDTSPVLAGIIADQTHLQRVYVGDDAQSIYGFTGAINAMAGLTATAEGRLTQSWRFGPAVAEAANTLLARLGDDMRLTGNPGRDSIVDRAVTGSAILARTNATAIEHVMAAQRAGKRVHLMGENRYAVQFCDDADALRKGARPRLADLAAFTSWDQVVQHAEDSEDSADWKVLVALIEKYSTGEVRRALSGVVTETDADTIVATAHKSKGREWDSVVPADDLAEAVATAQESVRQARAWIADEGRLGLDINGDPLPEDVKTWRIRRSNAGQTPHQALDRSQRRLRDELMLAYVAVTRARLVLNPAGLLALPAMSVVAG
ncbi:UvrD-helicase domain-containing protein [Nocardia transvalensis]|uniref:UvrD-helicase domain-containing protein n=1 Tax=Nocardia transvalensis TaxID=37333 RepID=UPI00189634EB|nr:UvrD-helicase domain-containing protein [Nocardia transvalensis]MBF6332450.1 ATP-dependent helicase [Nocardia transvalensis]